ncbi:LPS-assembly protein LptD [Brevundimonas sp. AJA228-03]|uniref:LPS-assembly protein LptD n=1 Tax=Brevundimonas sp. AJA228-03 TaxID=2752515 RepID=UPI001ADF4BC6|nr:LPS assembly protein LptD [Brevundimonas sp. AJA228-03]QTN18941.1 LPS-assembly protein LptD [Brevundimonas sp. AJA228-03]
MQADRGPLFRHRLRIRLLTGSVLAAWALSSLALAQTPSRPTSPPAVDLPVDAVYLEADQATRQGNVITATGERDRVYARFQNRSMRGRAVTYDIGQGVGVADGEVELTDPDGNVVHASHLELDSDLKAGVAVDLATRLTNGASLMAATAVRRSENVNELNYALFTPCPVCDAEGHPKEPSLSIQAEKVVQDEALRAVLYRNAVFKIGGVPVFWTPYFAHPDPTVDRASGFLVPITNYDQGRGVSIETPYLRVISPSEDWLISPQFNTGVVPFLNLQWRRRFSNGTILARTGYTYAQNFGDFDLDGDGSAESNVDFGDKTSRSYVLSWGRFDPAGPWRWGFTAERTSDKTLFDRYDVIDPYQDNGLYYGDQRRLISQLYAERQTARSYLSVAAFSFQSLRVARFNDVTPALNVFENDGSLPLVAPLIDGRWEPEQAVLGGRLRLRGSAVSLYRDDYVGSPVLRPQVVPRGATLGLPGVDSRRVTAQIDWRRSLTSAAGIRYEPFIDGRIDVYSVADLPPVLGLADETITRERATIGLDVSYPLIRHLGNGADLIVEPLGQISLSNAPDVDARIPVEDSETLELDESSLFRIDRFPGHDLLEGGFRFTAGVRSTLRWDSNRSASLFVGRSMRDADQIAFGIPIPDAPTKIYDPTGVGSQTSDWVVQASFQPSDRIRGWGHATVDGSGNIRRAETAVDGRWGRRNLATLSYIVDRSNPLTGPNNRNYEFVQLAGQQFVHRNWGVTVAGIADLERNLITRSEVGLLFDDDCFRVEVGYRRDNTRVRPTGPSDGVYVRLNLATFGGSGYGSNGLR